jgi:DNA recombination protein RmuC
VQIDLLIYLGATAAGALLVGVLIAALILRGQAAAAREQGRSEVAAELVAASERARSLDAELERLKAQHATTTGHAQTLQEELQQRKNQLSALHERATRIPKLEADCTALADKLDAEKNRSAEQREASGRLAAELEAERETVKRLRSDLQSEKVRGDELDVKHQAVSQQLTQVRAEFDGETKKSAEKLALLLQAKQELSDQFKTLATEILEEKSKRFAEQNQTHLSQLINPLKERITEFKTKVEEIHNKDTEQQATLRTELTQLKELNRQMTQEAHGLATALKGQAKMQGNWGELVLGNVLDRSGLRDGKDFKREVSFTTEDGRKRPDVIIYLPQSKHLIIDAKVSLNAYTRYVNAEDDLERQQALQEHVKAVGSRIQELSNRAYFELPGLNTPEMVFMFIPIESAFVEALRADESLFQKAIEQNVLVATPTTLLTSLNIVRQLWRFEEQNAHTAELADRAGKVYKKLVSFLGSMEAVGAQLERAKESFAKAMGQLYTGKGNLINQAKEFERLGVSVQSPLPEHLVAKAELELEHFPDSIEEQGSTDPLLVN